MKSISSASVGMLCMLSLCVLNAIKITHNIILNERGAGKRQREGEHAQSFSMQHGIPRSLARSLADQLQRHVRHLPHAAPPTRPLGRCDVSCCGLIKCCFLKLQLQNEPQWAT